MFNKGLNFNSIFQKDFLNLLLLLIVTTVIIYSAPVMVIRLFFLLLLFQFYRSDKGYFWLVFLFILIETPGGLFTGFEGIEVKRIPMYPITSGISLGFYDLFMILALIKIYIKRIRSPIFLKAPMNMLLAYFVFLYIYSILLGMSSGSHIYAFRIFLTFSMFIVIPSLLGNQEQLGKFIGLILPCVLMFFATQVYQIASGGKELLGFLVPEKISPTYLETGEMIRPETGANLVFYTNFISLLILSFSIKTGKKFYLLFIATISFLSIIFTGTRGWFLAFIFFLLGFIFVNSNNPVKSFGYIIVTILIFLMFYFSAPLLKHQVDAAIQRLTTVELILQGDPTAGGTNLRLTERNDNVMNKFRENPIFGFGFSDEFNKFNDGHVGNQNLLLNVGIVGFSLFFIVIFLYIRKIVLARSTLKQNNGYRKGINIFIVGILALYIIHSSSVQIFGYNVCFSQINKMFLLALFLTTTDVILKEAFKENQLKSIN